MEQVTRLYPTPNATRALAGLFLDEPLRELARAGDPFVYTNFVSSLDGRIAVRDESGRWGVPSAISTSQDHRLYRELAAQADVVLVSVRHAKGMLNNDALQPFPWLTPADDSDLKQWRLARGLSESPALAVATTRLQFPGGELQRKLACPVHCLTGTGPTVEAKEAMQNDNVDVLVGEDAVFVGGANMRRLLAQKGYRLIYSVAGPGVMNALLEDRVLDRLYLTQVDTLVGGEEFHTLYSAAAGQNDQTLALQALYRCEPEDAPAQQFSVYDVLRTREAG